VAVLLSGAEAQDAREGVRDLLGRVATTGADRWLLIGALAGAPFVRAVEEEAQGPAPHPFAASALARLGAAAQGAVHAPWLEEAFAALGDGTPTPLLTAREVAVLDLLAAGRSYADIGNALYISRNTVKSHVTAIYRKLGVDRAVQAALVARRYGMLPKSGEGR
jgi:DNA-binding NarL/FixJ family response regulator